MDKYRTERERGKYRTLHLMAPKVCFEARSSSVAQLNKSAARKGDAIDVGRMEECASPLDFVDVTARSMTCSDGAKDASA